MKLFRLLSICIVSVLVSACVTPIPIDNLTYRGASTVTTDKTARIIVTSSGAGTSSSTYLMPVAGGFISREMKGKGPFGAEDQNDFAQSLRKELVRLGVVKSVTEGEDAADMVATINIDHASFNGDWVEYKLDLTMSITGGKLPYQQRYHVVSTEKDSIWQKMNTNGAEGREKLAHLMLERLIPDIERYALAMTRP